MVRNVCGLFVSVGVLVIGVFDFNSEIWVLMNSVSYDSVEQHLDASCTETKNLNKI